MSQALGEALGTLWDLETVIPVSTELPVWRGRDKEVQNACGSDAKRAGQPPAR